MYYFFTIQIQALINKQYSCHDINRKPAAVRPLLSLNENQFMNELLKNLKIVNYASFLTFHNNFIGTITNAIAQ